MYCSPNIIQMIKSRACSTYGGQMRSAYRVLVGKPEKKRSLGRSRRRWEDNIKMHLQEVAWVAWTILIWLGIWTGGGLL